jgi:RNA polymerase sigma-70 factor, ECF subfamily
MVKEKDLILVKKALTGDKKAFARLYQQYFEPIYRFCFYKTSKKKAAEDLTQDVFLKVLESLQNFKAESSFKNWIYGIAKNTVMDYYRKHYEINKIALEEWHWIEYLVLSDKEREKALNKKQKKVKSILKALKPKYKKVLNLRFLKGYTIKEVAKELNLTQGNVKVIQYRAIKKLKKLNKKKDRKK